MHAARSDRMQTLQTIDLQKLQRVTGGQSARDNNTPMDNSPLMSRGQGIASGGGSAVGQGLMHQMR